MSGSTTPARKPAKVPPLDVPAISVMSSLAHAGARPLVITEEDTAYRELKVASGSEVILRGPLTIKTRSLVLEPSAKLTIDTTGGPVMLFAGWYVDLAPGSLLDSVTDDPTQFAFAIGASGEVDIDRDGTAESAVTIGSSGELHGLIYAPRSDLALPSNLRTFGAITANTIHFAPNSHFTFDEAMLTTGVTITGLPRLLSWRIVELPDVPLMKIRLDPRRLLEQAGVTPQPSAKAYEETFIGIDYIDIGGVPRTYEGTEAAFDWTQVRDVDKMRWGMNAGDLATARESTGAQTDVGLQL